MISATIRLAGFLAAVNCLAGCGANAAVVRPSAGSKASGSATGPDANQLAGTPNGGPTATPQTKSSNGGSVAAEPEATAHPKQVAPATSAAVVDTSEEVFPSGLVVDAKLLGGPAPGPELPRGTRILHVGDSFAGALGIELNKVLQSAGIKSRLEFEKSTYIPTWAHNPKLGALLQSFKPELVIISLGANELQNPEPAKRAPLIQKLVKSLGTTPCVWIAPVLWEGAKDSLLSVIRANVGSCIYLDSNALVKKMPRAGDKIHPSMAARPDWAAATARWLAYHRKPTETQPWAIAVSP